MLDLLYFFLAVIAGCFALGFVLAIVLFICLIIAFVHDTFFSRPITADDITKAPKSQGAKDQNIIDVAKDWDK